MLIDLIHQVVLLADGAVHHAGLGGLAGGGVLLMRAGSLREVGEASLLVASTRELPCTMASLPHKTLIAHPSLLMRLSQMADASTTFVSIADDAEATLTTTPPER